MSWPKSVIGTSNVDSSLDSPAKFRAQLLTLVQHLNTIVNGRGKATGVASLNASGSIPGTQISSQTAVASSGSTMTGALVLHGNPTAYLHVATKRYVDERNEISASVTRWGFVKQGSSHTRVESLNISSVSDSGAGLTKINFTKSHRDLTYAVVLGGGQDTDTVAVALSLTKTSFSLAVRGQYGSGSTGGRTDGWHSFAVFDRRAIFTPVAPTTQPRTQPPTEPTKPGPVRNLNESSKTSTTITWGWGAPTTGASATGYEYRWAQGTPSGSYTSNGRSTSVTISGLSAGTTYTINVRALAGSVRGDSRSDTATTSAAAAFSAVVRSGGIGFVVTFTPSNPTSWYWEERHHAVGGVRFGRWRKVSRSDNASQVSWPSGQGTWEYRVRYVRSGSVGHSNSIEYKYER